MNLYKVSFFVLRFSLVTFIVFRGFYYSASKGVDGGGYKVGFSVGPYSYIAILLLLFSIPVYAILKRKIKSPPTHKG